METVFDKIKKLADSREISIVDVEADLGLSKNYLYKWKKSAPNSAKLIEVADYFDVSTDQLLGREKISCDNINILYINVKELAAKRNISLAQIERDLHFSNGLISSWKNGQASQDKLSALADYFNVSTDYLLGNNTKYNNTYTDHTALEKALDNAKTFEGIPMSDQDRKIIRGILKGYFTYKN